MEEPPLVSIVTVTWNAPQYVRRFYESLDRHTQERVELIVVDNASLEETRAINRERAARSGSASGPGMTVRLVQNEDNVLWAKGCNQGMALADPRAEFLLLLNPDCEVLRSDWIARLRGVLDGDRSVAVTGPFLNWKRIGPVFGCVDGSVFFVRQSALRLRGVRCL